MATKDGLTRDEAREAIEILALREDNLENIAMGGILIVGTLVGAFFTIIAFNLATYFLNINNPYSYNLLILNLPFFVFFSFLAFYIHRLANIKDSKSKDIEETMKKLAKRYNLEEFLNAVSGKKSV